VHGDIINNTDAAQQLEHISGTLYDAGGQLIADDESIADFWPIDVVPPGQRAAFRLIVEGVQSAAQFSLSVEAEPSGRPTRQDFEFLSPESWREEAEYCVAGRLRNPGGALQRNLLIVLVLYDDQDRVVNFGDYYESSPESLAGGQTLDFEVCADEFNQDIARYELRAWGE
jgi:hypothetical protein